MANKMINKDDFTFKLIESKSPYDKMFAILIKSIKDAQWANFFMKQMDFIKNICSITHGFGAHSYYSNGKICINFDEALLGIGVVVHEYGHYIFDKMVNKEEEDAITNIFKEEASHFIKDKQFLGKLHKTYCPNINWLRIIGDRKYCPAMLTDGISMLSGKSYIGINHDPDYSVEHLASELFAECLETEVLGYKNSITIYKGEIPKTYSYIKNKIYEVLNP